MSTLVLDTSALVAIALEEPECDAFLDRLEEADDPLISAMTYVELGIVLVRRRFLLSREDLDAWLVDFRIRVARYAVIEPLALDAHIQYGKGRHPAQLNLGDCFPYALAKGLDAPLLYKGDDFAQTDVRSAL
ncbi:type II toxin-antitoxin system VapC family toxin [Caulobacter sp.]|uniref:type II toxin-antitoxin system VapC family toxin n=1 Tax=Caulobacter sp. TaxID=78 RepID=UPI001B0A4A44|nr:type II toxin-antitoxin system VapC family toxin [Caulobacter sp.]MBO9546597.1 type II toxin-antitoxin system VapC family toxin [Caulobacter sp.]